MKKALLISVVILSLISSVDAQWYYRNCGVKDITNCSRAKFKCLWKNASNNVIGGTISTAIGTSSIVAGIIVASRDYAAGDIGPIFGGIIITTGGIILDLVGITTCIVGAHRKSELRKNPHYDDLNLGTLNLSPTINRNYFNNSYSVGLTVILSF